MKFSEQHELVQDFIEEFAEKEVEPVALSIERESVERQLILKMAERGYLGALAPEELGGANLDQVSYMLLLELLAKRSPSLSFIVFMQNSLVLNLLGRDEMVRDVATGKQLGAVSLRVLERANRAVPAVEHGKLRGEEELLCTAASFIIVPVAEGGEEKLALLDKGFSLRTTRRGLGFRGAGLGLFSIDAEENDMRIIGDGDAVRRVLLESSRHVAAIALGIAEGALEKAVAYAKQRSAFGSKLERFQPIAFDLTLSLSRIDALREYLFRNVDGPLKEGLAAKIMLLDAALEATRTAMQVHGGNGYFEEYGIEKYYRDAMALNTYTSDRTEDMINLSHFILGKESAEL